MHAEGFEAAAGERAAGRAGRTRPGRTTRRRRARQAGGTPCSRRPPASAGTPRPEHALGAEHLAGIEGDHVVEGRETVDREWFVRTGGLVPVEVRALLRRHDHRVAGSGRALALSGLAPGHHDRLRVQVDAERFVPHDRRAAAGAGVGGELAGEPRRSRDGCRPSSRARRGEATHSWWGTRRRRGAPTVPGTRPRPRRARSSRTRWSAVRRSARSCGRPSGGTPPAAAVAEVGVRGDRGRHVPREVDLRDDHDAARGRVPDEAAQFVLRIETAVRDVVDEAVAA